MRENANEQKKPWYLFVCCEREAKELTDSSKEQPAQLWNYDSEYAIVFMCSHSELNIKKQKANSLFTTTTTQHLSSHTTKITWICYMYVRIYVRTYTGDILSRREEQSDGSRVKDF